MTAVIIPFPKPYRERIDVTFLLWQEVRQTVKDRGWKGFRPELSADRERCWIVRTG